MAFFCHNISFYFVDYNEDDYTLEKSLKYDNVL